jgi:hypothetical protein
MATTRRAAPTTPPEWSTQHTRAMWKFAAPAKATRGLLISSRFIPIA